MIPWRQIPFVRITIIFILGILAERFYEGAQIVFLFISISILIFETYVDYYSRKIYDSYSFYSGGLLLFLFFSVGYLVSYMHNPSLDSKHYMHYADRNIYGIGVIQEIPIKRTSYRTEIKMESLCNEKEDCIEVNHKAIIYFSKEDNEAPTYRPGDRILFYGKLTEISQTTNPYSFDFKSYLWNRGITHQTYIWGDKKHKLLNSGNLSFMMQMAMDSRAKFLNIFDKYIKSPDQNSIVSAMVLGYRNTVSEEMYKAFSDTGSVHILAVSGMHLVFLAALLELVFSRIKIKYKRLKLLIKLALLWFFALMTGAAPAVIRAAIMFTIILYGRQYKRFQNMYNILAFCALIMLVYDPYMLFQASFQFSFLALLSLAYFQPFVSPLITPKSKYLQKIWEYFSATIAAQILVIPITIFFFHKFPTYFILSGFLPVVLSNWALYISILLVFIESFTFVPILGKILHLINEYLIGPILDFTLILFIKSVTILKELPFNSIDGLTLSSLEFIMFIVFLLGLMYYMVDKNLKTVYLMGLAVFIGIVSFSYRLHISNHQLKVVIYDVNKGGMVDFFDGRNAYNLTFDTLENNQKLFINQNNQYYHFINVEHKIDFSKDFTGNRIKKQGKFIQIKDKKFYILKEQEDLCQNFEIADFILLMGNVKFEDCFKLRHGQMLIIDKKIKYNNIKEWKDRLNEGQIYDIRKEGSLTINIEI